MTTHVRGPIQKCGRCGAVTPAEEFHHRVAGYQAWCKACVREWDAEYHQRSRPIRYVQRKLRHQQMLNWLSEFESSRPCADRGGFFRKSRPA